MIKKIFQIIILLIPLLTQNAFAKSPPPGTGSANIPANILIALDTSGSMGWQAGQSDIDFPVDVQVDSSGNVYVMEYLNSKIKVFNSSGTLIRTIGKQYSGYWNSSSSCNGWRYARQFTIHNNQIYIMDTGNNRMLRLNLDGTCAKINNRPVIQYKQYPVGVTGWRSIIYGTGYVYGSNWAPNTICLYDRIYLGENGKACYGTFRSINFGWSMTTSKDNKYISVADTGNRRIHTWIPNTGGGQQGALSQSPQVSCSVSPYIPYDLAYDTNGAIYFTTSQREVRKLSSYNNCTSTRVGYTSQYAYGITIDRNNKIYITESSTNKVRIFDRSWNETLSFGGTSRLDLAKKAIKKIVSSSDLTSAANFGLMSWNSSPRMEVNISNSGASTILSSIDNLTANGGTNLYSALLSANSYFKGSNSPIINGASCQKNFVIVISDGEWQSHSSVVGLAKSMASNSPPINTIAVGFALSGPQGNYNDLAKAGCAFGDQPSCTKSVPLYANNEQELITKLNDAIKQIIASSLTFTTPAVMSDTQKGDFVYQSTFEYEPYKQWKGHLKKHPINSNGTLGTAIWDAADKLNSKNADKRNIWTVGLSSTNLNNFTTSYRDELKSLLFSSSSTSDDKVDKLINFIRGKDSYDEDSDGNITETRHKLADIYNSDIIVVGPPDQPIEYQNTNQDAYYRNINNYNSFKTGNTCGGSCQSRKEIVLAGSNGGMLHAFDSSNGEELWGFIPPSILKNLSKVISDRPNTSNAIYGVDGSPIVKDIYYNNTWKTVLIAGLGAGGHSYFALDITNPISPKHLFTIDNDPFTKVISFWDADGNIQIFGYSDPNSAFDEDKDYRKLGEAWSNPRIIRIKVRDTNNNLVDKWVAVFGGGYNGASNPNYGSAVFVMNLENDGYLVKKIDITDSSSSNIINSIPADLTVITPDSTVKANYSGAMVYAADLEGKVTKINLTNQGTLYQTTQLFDAQSSTTNGRYIYKTAEATINDDNNLWLYFGTGDVQKIQTRNSSVQNRLYGIKDKDFPEFKTVSPAGNITNCTIAGTCPGSGQLGWYMNLSNSRKLTAMPTIQGDVVYFPLYEPTSSNVCAYGDAILSALNSKCGGANFIKKLGTGVLTKVVTNKDKIIVGISGEADKASGFNNQGNLLIGNAVGKAPVQGIQVETWRQN